MSCLCGDVWEHEKESQTEHDNPQRVWILAAGSDWNGCIWVGDGVQSEQGLKTRRAHEQFVAQQRDMTLTEWENRQAVITLRETEPRTDLSRTNGSLISKSKLKSKLVGKENLESGSGIALGAVIVGTPALSPRLFFIWVGIVHRGDFYNQRALGVSFSGGWSYFCR